MRKTSFTFIPPDYLSEEIDPHLLSKIFSLFLPFANSVEGGLTLPDGYGLMWTLKWNTYRDCPMPKSVFATVSLCSAENSPRAFDEFIHSQTWSLGRGLVEAKTSKVVVCVVESKELIQITENDLDTFGLGSSSVDHIVSTIIEELSSALEGKEAVFSNGERLF